MRPGVTIVTIPGPWYVTTRLTGPVERGTQPKGAWTGLAGAELDIHAGEPVNSSVLQYLVSRFGGFDVIIAAEHSEVAEHTRVLATARRAREARNTGQHLDLSQAVQQAAAIWAVFDRRAHILLTSMQRSGEPLTDSRLPAWNRPVPPNLGREWVIATFRHNTDHETDDPLPHTHNIVPAITEYQWTDMRNLGEAPPA